MDRLLKFIGQILINYMRFKIEITPPTREQWAFFPNQNKGVYFCREANGKYSQHIDFIPSVIY